MTDMVNHPPHYNTLPVDIECIDVIEHLNFCRGSAIKYIWRAGEKGDPIQDLEKGIWYLRREIERIKRFEAWTQADLDRAEAKAKEWEALFAADPPNFWPGEQCPKCNNPRSLLRYGKRVKCVACGLEGAKE